MDNIINLPIYDVTLGENDIGLTAISLVDYPAIEVDFIAMRKENQPIFLQRDKHEIVGPLLIPDQLIYRRTQAGEPYYIRWSADTIKMAAERYVLNGWFENFTEMHSWFENPEGKYEDSFVKNIYLLRLWIIEDEENDDAKKLYGFDLPKGTLMAHAKVLNRHLWKEIKEGNLRGFSIESFMSKNNNLENNIQSMFDIKAKDMTMLQKLVMFLNENVNQSSASEKAEQIVDEVKGDETDSGVVELKYYLDDEHYFTIGDDSFVYDEQGNKINEGRYRLADGNIFIVSPEGKFDHTEEVNEIEEKEDVEQAPINQAKTDEDKNKEDEKDDSEGETKARNDSDDENSDSEDGEQNEGNEADGDSKSDGENDEDDDKKSAKDGSKKDEKIKQSDELKELVIDDENFMVDEKVINLVTDLKNEIERLNQEVIKKSEEYALLQEKTPSAEPIGNVVKTPEHDNASDEEDKLSIALSMLNKRFSKF